MARSCSVCTHSRRKQIDLLIVGGTPISRIAKSVGVTESALRRHAENHVSPALRAAAAGESETEALDLRGTLLQRVDQIVVKAAQLLKAAEDAGNITAAITVCRELAKMVELQGKLAGEISTAPQLSAVVVLPANGRDYLPAGDPRLLGGPDDPRRKVIEGHTEPDESDEGDENGQ